MNRLFLMPGLMKKWSRLIKYLRAISNRTNRFRSSTKNSIYIGIIILVINRAKNVRTRSYRVFLLRKSIWSYLIFLPSNEKNEKYFKYLNNYLLRA